MANWTSSFAWVLGLLVIGCGGDEELRNGYVRLQLLRAASQTVNGLEGTATVVARVQYGECLADFYAANPSYRQQGEIGAGDFGDGSDGGEGWIDRLCDGSVDAATSCEVVSIEQNLQVGRLTVTYAVDALFDNSQLVFGPLPTIETADCSAGLLPTVRVTSNDSLQGRDADGNKLWEAVSFDPLEAATGPSSVIRASR